MQLSTKVIGTTFEAHLADRMSFADHKAFREMLQQVTASGAKHCIIDVKDLMAIDSAGLGMFIIAVDSAKSSGWTLTLRGANGQVKQLLLLAKFDKLIPLSD